MADKFYVVLGDMTVGGARAIFVSTGPWAMDEAIAEFDNKQDAEDYITEWLEDDDYDQYYRY